MKQESPYALADDTVNHIAEQCERIGTLDHTSTQQERVRVLNYLRTVRTTIELMEHEIMKGTG